MVKENQFVKVYGYNGKVIKIFDDGDNPLVEIQFVKNIAKGQRSEYHRWNEIKDKTSESNIGDIEREYLIVIESIMSKYEKLISLNS